jgi:hypothetical protein
MFILPITPTPLDKFPAQLHGRRGLWSGTKRQIKAVRPPHKNDVQRNNSRGKSCDRSHDQKPVRVRGKSVGPTTRAQFRFSTTPVFPAPAPPNSARNHTAVKSAPTHAMPAAVGTPPAVSPWQLQLDLPTFGLQEQISNRLYERRRLSSRSIAQ